MEGIPQDASYIAQLELEDFNSSFISRRHESASLPPVAVPKPIELAGGIAVNKVMGFAGQTWRERARCRTISPDLFFSNSEEDQQKAVRVCQACPVMEDCRDYAISSRQEHGVWGGLLEKELRALRAQNTPKR